MDSDLIISYELFKKSIACKPVISSGHRTPKKNKAVGGSKNSYHLSGKAYDLTFPMCLSSMEDLGRMAARFFNGVIVYPRHIHVDVREKPYFGKGKY